MKLKYILSAVLLLTSATVWGQKDMNKFPKFGIGVHTGLDIGAAVPNPPSSIGGGSKINAVPYLTPELGISGNIFFDDRWSANVEVTYKKFGIEADAWVTDQRFIDPDNRDRVVSFRGSTEVRMRFTMLEVPVYAGYTFGNGKNRAILGLYYARVFKAEFAATPLKGMLTNVNNPEDVSPVSPEEPFTQKFNDSMDTWDIGFLAGYERRIIENLNIGIRFSMGFKDIFKPDAKQLAYKMLHMRGTVVLSYKLFNF